METTLAYMLALVLLALLRPLVGVFGLIVLPQPGITGLFQDAIGLKPWAGHPACVALGLVAAARGVRRRDSDNRGTLLLLVSSGLFVVAANILNGDNVQAFMFASFHGGFLAALIVHQWENPRLWKVMIAGVLVLLVLSAATYWLGDTLPFLTKLDGMAYGEHVEVARRASQLEDLVERASRGAGVFANPNCWAQVAGFGVIVGLGMIIVTQGETRLFGSVLLISGLLGTLGAMGRSATLGTLMGAAILLVGRFVARSAVTRAIIVAGAMLIGAFVVSWAEAQAARNARFQLGSEGGDWRTQQVLGVLERIDRYWAVGGVATGTQMTDDSPHDIVMAYIYYFGAFPALVTVLAILGGGFIALRWIRVGGRRLGEELRLPQGMSWVGEIVVPVFVMMMVSGLGNGLAGGAPYRELFLLYAYAAIRVRGCQVRRSERVSEKQPLFKLSAVERCEQR